MTSRAPADLAAAAQSATDDAVAIAGKAGVRIAELDDVDGLQDVAELLRRVWGADTADQIVNLSTLRALAHAGNYVAAAYREGELVAATVAFLGAGHLHSHVTGVVPGGQGRGVGYALKLHQRAWALQRGIPRVCWTFDPLVRRNAHFNLQKLGAQATEYLVDFYGPLADGINLGDPSDRLYVSWELTGERATAAIQGALAEPEPGPSARLVPTPPDIEALRAADPAEARRWRYAVREGLSGPLAAGWMIAGITREGSYVLEAAA
jgi:predicted GNAT superfamily acetyltransferase